MSETVTIGDAPQPQATTSENPEVVFKSGRRATIRQLNGLEQVRIDSYAPAGSPAAIAYYRAAAALVTLDGQTLPPIGRDKGQVEYRLQLLKGSESDQLALEYQRLYGLPMNTDDLKNESGPEDSQQV